MDDIRQQLAEKYDLIIAETLLELRAPLTKKKLTTALYAANKAYWVARLAMLDADTVYDAERVAAALSVPYMSAMETFSKRVRSIYANYQSAFDLSQKDVKRLLKNANYDRTIAQTLRSIADGMSDGPEKNEILAQISAPAYKYRLDRAEQMCKQAAQTCEDIRNGELPTVWEFLQTEVEKAYNISADEILKMPSQTIIDDITGTERGISDSLTLIDTRTVNEIVNAEWSGENFSEAIWDNTAALAKNVKKVLIEGELTGASEGKMAEKVAKAFETGMYEARRVVRTESNYCTTQAEKQALTDAGFDEYEFLTVHEENICDTCDDLDGKRFKISDGVIGVNLPPLHPFCRCRISSPEETEEDIQADIDRMLGDMSIEDIEQRLNQMIAEREQIGTTDNSADGVDKFAENDIINNNETNDDKYSAVTEDDINRVPSMDIFGDNELNLAHEQASRDILEEVKRQQELGAIENGVEISIIYDKDMNEFNGMKYIVGERDKTEIVDLTVPYHAFHTHPDDRMFSLSDLQGIANRDNMLSLTAQGERGSKYVVVKSSKFDQLGYKTYLEHKSQDVIYSNGSTKFSLDFMSDTSNNSPYTQALKALDDKQYKALKMSVYNKMDEILTGGEKYGIKYYHQETGMAYR